MSAPPRLSRRHVRTLQRVLHLVAGALLVGYVYLGVELDDGITAAMRWIVLPVLVVSGVALWKWQRIRALARGAR